MLSLLILPLQTEEGAGMVPYYVGGFSLLLLFGLLVALLSFGKGREHS
jgi:hypothetical protein